MNVHRVIGSATVVVCLLVMFTPLLGMVDRWFVLRRSGGPAEAIVVLGGGGLHSDGSLTDESLRRTMAGVDLYKRGLAPLLVLSGARQWTGHVEAEMRARLAAACGVPSSAIVLEIAALTTREEATNIGALLRAKGITKILLVVDPQASRRATTLFERRGLQALPVPTGSGSTATPEGRLGVARRLVIEATAWLYYRLAGYL